MRLVTMLAVALAIIPMDAQAGKLECAIGVRQHGVVVSKTGSGRFDVASIGKPLTALAVLLLVHDGKLTLDDDVHRWLPELPRYERPITLRQLLTHTSGLRDPDTLGGMAGRSGLDHARALQLMFRQRGLNHTPGTREMYTNGGYLLATEIVARVAKQPYARFVSTRIFAPLQLKDSTLTDDDSWIVSLDDLLTLDRALDGASVLGVAPRELWAPQTLSRGEVGQYTLGWERGRYRAQEVIEKNGAHGLARSDWLRFPAHGLSVIALCDDGAAAELVAHAQINRILDAAGAPPLTAEMPARSGPLPTAAQLAALPGTYVADADVIQVTLRDGGLRASQVPFPSLPLEPLGGQRFRLVGPPVPVTLQFSQLPDGTMQLIARDPEETTTAQRLPPAQSPPQLATLVGDYHSDELDVTYHVQLQGERLTVHIADEQPDELVPQSATLFVDGPLIFRFGRFAGDGFTLSRRRALGLGFRRAQK